MGWLPLWAGLEVLPQIAKPIWWQPRRGRCVYTGTSRWPAWEGVIELRRLIILREILLYEYFCITQESNKKSIIHNLLNYNYADFWMIELTRKVLNDWTLNTPLQIERFDLSIVEAEIAAMAKEIIEKYTLAVICKVKL